MNDKKTCVNIYWYLFPWRGNNIPQGFNINRNGIRHDTIISLQGFNINRWWYYTIMVAVRVLYAPGHIACHRESEGRCYSASGSWQSETPWFWVWRCVASSRHKHSDFLKCRSFHIDILYIFATAFWKECKRHIAQSLIRTSTSKREWRAKF